MVFRLVCKTSIIQYISHMLLFADKFHTCVDFNSVDCCVFRLIQPKCVFLIRAHAVKRLVTLYDVIPAKSVSVPFVTTH